MQFLFDIGPIRIRNSPLDSKRRALNDKFQEVKKVRDKLIEPVDEHTGGVENWVLQHAGQNPANRYP